RRLSRSLSGLSLCAVSPGLIFCGPERVGAISEPCGCVGVVDIPSCPMLCGACCLSEGGSLRLSERAKDGVSVAARRRCAVAPHGADGKLKLAVDVVRDLP